MINDAQPVQDKKLASNTTLTQSKTIVPKPAPKIEKSAAQSATVESKEQKKKVQQIP